MNYNNIQNLFENKNVCIIGPAKNLINKNEGINIDSYDIVCRINSSYIINKELIKDYGSRTDILFSTCNHTVSEAVKNNINYLKNCKVIINRTNKNHHGILACDIISKVTNNTIPFYQVSDNFYEKNKGLNTGILSILFLLSLEIKTLYIAGFDFYINSNNIEENYIFNHEKEYKNKPDNLPCVNGKKLLKGNISSTYWKDYQKKIINFFKNNLLNNKKVILHSSIKDILIDNSIILK